MNGLPPVIRLGNDVTRALRHLPPDEAVQAIATHLTKFWDPRMRRSLQALVDAGHPDVDPLLARAVGLVEPPHSRDETPTIASPR